MISRLHDKLGGAGLIVAVLALVAAVAGTALAAGGLTAQQEKQVTKIAKKYAGKRGPAGPQGSPGSPGSNGTNGAAGSPGSPGKGVVTATVAPGLSCSEGGISIEVEGSGTKKFVCNGEEGLEGELGPEGNPWTAGGTLPPNATETGSWSYSGKFAALPQPIVDISFSIPLAAPLGESAVHLINSNGEELVLNIPEEKVEEIPPTKCSGTAEEPSAASGNLCVYSGKLLVSGAGSFFASDFINTPASACSEFGCLSAFGGPGAGSSTAGARLTFIWGEEGGHSGWGTWAVTGGP